MSYSGLSDVCHCAEHVTCFSTGRITFHKEEAKVEQASHRARRSRQHIQYTLCALLFLTGFRVFSEIVLNALFDELLTLQILILANFFLFQLRISFILVTTCMSIAFLGDTTPNMK